MRKQLLSIVAVVAIAACAERGLNAFPHEYTCGKHKVLADFSGNVARINLDGMASVLQNVRAASGAKYALYDVEDQAKSGAFASIPQKQIIFWTKADWARLEFDGNSFECVKIK